jgi:hypothetical protein
MIIKKRDRSHTITTTNSIIEDSNRSIHQDETIMVQKTPKSITEGHSSRIGTVNVIRIKILPGNTQSKKNHEDNGEHIL